MNDKLLYWAMALDLASIVEKDWPYCDSGHIVWISDWLRMCVEEEIQQYER